MNFSDKLNDYISSLNCTYTTLAHASGLSKASISRYCNGTRCPANPSPELDKLIDGLSLLAQQQKSKITKEDIKNEFDTLLKTYDTTNMVHNINQIIIVLKINVSAFSKNLGFDASHLSRIRSGERHPSNPALLLNGLCTYIVKNYSDTESKRKVSNLLHCPMDHLDTNGKYKEAICQWLSSDYQELEVNTDINKFLGQLNDFDLNEYIRVIKFDELKVPTIPFSFPKSKNYYGIEEMKQGELDFFKATVLEKAMGEVFMCSNMQMDDMSKDLDFNKKWMFGIALMLEKGLHLNIIHNIDRPFNEMMLGLESWIPIYMTGQVTPYYLTNVQNSVYSHLNYVSSTVALTGECIKGYHNNGKYYLTNNKNEVSYYQEKEKELLKKAKPLMNIYRNDNVSMLAEFLDNDANTQGEYKIISSSLPIYTISDKLLKAILKRNKVNKSDSTKIVDFVNNERKRMQTILKTNKVNEMIGYLNKNEFNDYPLSLELSKLFFDRIIRYNYDEYLEHLKETEQYASDNANYVICAHKSPFRNIQITIHFKKWVMISKTNNPTIHFIIEQPKLRKAIETFVTPVIEK